MKTLVKILCLALAVCMCLTCAACGAAKTESNADAKEKLIMATNAAFPPYEYKEGDDFAGIDVEIAGLIADKLGMELEILDVEFGSIIGGVQSGKYDMGMAGMTVTDERLKSVNFSNTYANGIQSVIVKEDSKYTSFEDFYTGFDADELDNLFADDTEETKDDDFDLSAALEKATWLI